MKSQSKKSLYSVIINRNCFRLEVENGLQLFKWIVLKTHPIYGELYTIKTKSVKAGQWKWLTYLQLFERKVDYVYGLE